MWTIRLILAVMAVLYFFDAMVCEGTSNLRQPMFEVLKTILYISSGYILAKGPKDK